MTSSLNFRLLSRVFRSTKARTRHGRIEVVPLARRWSATTATTRSLLSSEYTVGIFR